MVFIDGDYPVSMAMPRIQWVAFWRPSFSSERPTMPIAKLKDYLVRNDVEYRLIPHARAIPAQEVAARSHITGHEIAKTVIVKIDGEFAMAVLPASEIIDLEQFAAIVGATLVELAYEKEFERFFNECEVGAMPPFGNLFGMKVYVDSELALDEQIVQCR